MRLRRIEVIEDTVQKICEWIEEIHKNEKEMGSDIRDLKFESRCGSHNLRFRGVREIGCNTQKYIFKCDRCDVEKEFLWEDLTLPQRDAIKSLGYLGKD